LVVQTTAFSDHPSVTLLPITGHLIDAPLLRIDIGPGDGLDRRSQIQVDKAPTTRRERIGVVVGYADGATITAVNRALAVLLGLVGPRVWEGLVQENTLSPSIGKGDATLSRATYRNVVKKVLTAFK
jgi:mRNA interferase MazF